MALGLLPKDARQKTLASGAWGLVTFGRVLVRELLLQVVHHEVLADNARGRVTIPDVLVLGFLLLPAHLTSELLGDLQGI